MPIHLKERGCYREKDAWKQGRASLIWSTILHYCRFATFQQRPPNRSEPLQRWWWPQERKLQTLLTEKVRALWHRSFRKGATLCFISDKTVISTISIFKPTKPSASTGTAAIDSSQLKRSASTLLALSILCFFSPPKPRSATLHPGSSLVEAVSNTLR